MLRICVPQKLGVIWAQIYVLYRNATQSASTLLYFTVKLSFLLDKCEPEAKLWFFNEPPQIIIPPCKGCMASNKFRLLLLCVVNWKLLKHSPRAVVLKLGSALPWEACGYSRRGLSRHRKWIRYRTVSRYSLLRDVNVCSLSTRQYYASNKKMEWVELSICQNYSSPNKEHSASF